MTAPTKTSAFQPSRYIWKGPALSEARSLPANCYTSEAFFKAEVENIHARGWIIVGRVDEWANPGQYRSIETVGGPALIVKDEAGTLRAFANFCRPPRRVARWKAAALRARSCARTTRGATG